MSSDLHIRTAFDRDLDQLQAQMLRMGGLVEVAILDAAKSFENQENPRKLLRMASVGKNFRNLGEKQNIHKMGI